MFHRLDVNGQPYPVVVYVPRGRDPRTPMPGLLFLHGLGECGDDGSRHLLVGLPPAIMADPDRWPFVVVMPQKRDFDASWEDHDLDVMAILDRAIERYNIDPRRVALTGLSQGGHGAIALGAEFPDRFRAVAPVCGFVKRRFTTDNERDVVDATPGMPEVALVAGAYAESNTPVWLIHGETDDVVPPSESIVLHAAIKQRGGDSKLMIYPGVNHGVWDKAYRESGLWEWLAEHTKE